MTSSNTSADRLSRRQFLARAGAAGVCAAAAGRIVWPETTLGQDRAGESDLPAPAEPAIALSDREAMFYEKLPDGLVACGLCPRACRVPDGQRGRCGVRANRSGTYKTLVYGRACAVHLDPIEKKPLYHYLPGTNALSVGTVGCNFSCKFCQNWEISQATPDKVASLDLPPEKLVAQAQARASPTLAFTYTEPTVFYEYMHDAAKLARRQGLGSAIISNGFMAEKPLRQLCEQLTAVKVDFKAYDEKFYRDVCGGELKPVLETMKTCRKIGIHLEIVVLIIPTLNDADEQVRGLSRWVLDNLGPDVPLHFSRFTPMYKMRNLPPTPLKTLERAHELARQAGLHYVYIGNVPMHEAGHTYCHKCGTMLIKRIGYVVRENLLADRTACPKCDTPIPGIWSSKQAFAPRQPATATRPG